MGDQRYKFKWSNVDLDDFVEQRKFAATNLRRQAADLTLRADQIDEEIAAWKTALEVPDGE